MKDQVMWEQQVNELKKLNGFDPNFDLAKDFMQLPLYGQKKDANRAALQEISQEKDAAVVLVTNAIQHLKEASISLQKIHPVIQKIINTDNKILNIEEMITECLEINDWTIHSKNYIYSILKMYINRLCAIFYKGTGTMPVCKPSAIKKQESNSSYTGNFYDFLIQAKPLLLEIDIDLGDNDETIGGYAYEAIKGNPKKKIESFQTLCLEEQEIEKIRAELL